MSTLRLVVLDGKALNPGDLSWSGFESLGQCVVYDRTPEGKVLQHIGNAEIVLTNKTLITAETIRQAPNLKYIGVLATGYNVVDTDAARETGVVVTNIPAYSTNAVAQLVFALLLEACHHVGEHSHAVHEGKWVRSKDFSYWNYPLIELAGKTMGIIGLGQIGKAVARISEAFGMKVLAYTRTPNPALESDNLRFVALDELLAESDVVSLNCPLTPETSGIINKGSLAKMKHSAILINTARGGLIDEDALREALDNCVISFAAVDVVSLEPMVQDNPLLGAKNIIITPHIGWAPLECRVRLMDIAVRNIKHFLEDDPINVVN